MSLNAELWKKFESTSAELRQQGFRRNRDMADLYRADDELSIKPIQEYAVPLRDGVVSVRSRPRSDVNRQLKK